MIRYIADRTAAELDREAAKLPTSIPLITRLARSSLLARSFVVIIAFTLSACERSAEQIDLANKRRADECLNKICTGDRVPKRDFTKEQIFKRNGRWFVGPEEYGVFDGSLGFYWPSRTPRNTANTNFPEHSLHAAGKAGQATIEFFVEPGEPKGETYSSITDDESRKSNLSKREMLRPGLELRTSKPDANGYWQYFVATDLNTPSGVPAMLACRIASGPYCSMGFAWNNLPVYVRFTCEHAPDWPEIYAEILRVLALIREVKP